ncbi:hypothetical protein ACO0LG_17225 [Undibacterium sp. Ji42W]|uniref:hypothetical protein n=1 Tax=Undibacterium sp. Ji42W TaxID=3413039 RepID=UPI003BEF819B
MDINEIEKITEVSRLSKVILFIDEILIANDLELIPENLWDAMKIYSDECCSQIEAFNSNQDIGFLKGANTCADKLLIAIRPYTIINDDVVKSLQHSLFNYHETVELSVALLKKNSNKANLQITASNEKSIELLASISKAKEDIDELHGQLFGLNDQSQQPSIKEDINAVHQKFLSEFEQVKNYSMELLIGNNDRASTKRLILEAQEDIESAQEEIHESLADTEKKIDELNIFHTKIFGKSIEGQDRPEDGLKNEIEMRMKILADFESEQNKRYIALNEQIETLLPGATSAGLASAYKEMADSFKKPIDVSTNLFLACIVSLVLMTFFFSIDSVLMWPEFSIRYVKHTDYLDVIKGILFKIPFYAPVIWLALYATKRRSESQRLQQEYAHKEALAKSYKSYRDQLAALGDLDNEMQKDLIKKTIDAIAYNASDTLDSTHGDKMPIQEAFEKALDGLQKSKSVIDKLTELGGKSPLPK